MDYFIKVAASYSSEIKKQQADVVCTGEHDELILNGLAASLTCGGTIRLFALGVSQKLCKRTSQCKKRVKRGGEQRI